MMENPVRRERRRLGLTQNQLAIIAGVSAVGVYEAERGSPAKISPAVLRALECAGVDGEKLAMEYAAWRDLEGLRLREALRQGIVKG